MFAYMQAWEQVEPVRHLAPHLYNISYWNILIIAKVSRRFFTNRVRGWSLPEEQAQQSVLPQEDFHYILIRTLENKLKECQHMSGSHVKTCFTEKPDDILFEDFNHV